jgi:hypothetical protein
MSKENKRPSLKSFLQNFKENMELQNLDPNVNLKKAKVESEVVPLVQGVQGVEVPVVIPVVPKVDLIIENNNKMRASIDLNKIASKYNSHIKDNFYKITIELENYSFVFTPTKLYLLIDNNSGNYVTCIYNLKMINNTNKEIIESNIPYYISNGHTNKLRANLLFPFICFNEENSKYECPYHNNNKLANGGLFKYDFIRILDMESINNSIKSKIPANKLKLLIDRSKEEIIGLSSVITRITNILDFLICINNKNVINYEEKNIKYYHIIYETNEELNMTKETEYRDDAEDLYKKNILSFLKKYIINIKKLPFFKSELINILIEKENIVTKSYFNKFLNSPQICKYHSINIQSELNVLNFTNISLNLGTEIKNKLHFLFETAKSKLEKNNINLLFLFENEKSKMEREMNNFIEDFILLFKDHIEVHKDKIMSRIISSWDARCYKKYLKYKQKYLQLKSKI